jgi:adenosylcobyric acid synthase
VAGLGLLDADIAFAPEKTLRRWEAAEHGLSGYEIHHGVLTRSADQPWTVTGVEVGVAAGAVNGTHWHGLLDNNEVRRDWLRHAAEAAHRSGFVVAGDTDVPARRDAQLDRMADLLTAHLDVDAVLALLDGAPPHRPTIVTGLRR